MEHLGDGTSSLAGLTVDLTKDKAKPFEVRSEMWKLWKCCLGFEEDDPQMGEFWMKNWISKIYVGLDGGSLWVLEYLCWDEKPISDWMIY